MLLETRWLNKCNTLILATAHCGNEKTLLQYPCGCSLTPEIQPRVVLNEVSPYMVTKRNGIIFQARPLVAQSDLVVWHFEASWMP